jgi:hypothetical protein
MLEQQQQQQPRRYNNSRHIYKKKSCCHPKKEEGLSFAIEIDCLFLLLVRIDDNPPSKCPPYNIPRLIFFVPFSFASSLSVSIKATPALRLLSFFPSLLDNPPLLSSNNSG